MKKRITAAAVVAMAVLLTIGWGLSGISNDYLRISRYKGLEIKKVTVEEVTDEDVQSAIDDVLSTNSVKTPITDRTAQSGDIVNIDFSGLIDGVAFDGGTASGRDIQLGSGSMVTGFEDALVGHGTGEQVEFDLAFPDSYSTDTNLAGKTAHWVVTINSISTEAPAELNDSFVKDVIDLEGITTVDEYKQMVREGLETQAQSTAEQTKEQEVWAALQAKTTFNSYPDGAIDEICNRYREQYQAYASMYGMEYTAFLESVLGMTEADFEAKIAQLAESYEQQILVTNAIAEKEKLTVDEAYYNENREAFAEAHNFSDADTMEQSYEKESLYSAMQESRVMEFLVSHAREVDEVSDTDTISEEFYDALYDISPALGSAVSPAAIIVLYVISGIFGLLSIIALWILFRKAGERGWASIIPFYNTYILFKITWGNGWLFLLLLIPFANIVIEIITLVKLSKAFGKGGGFAVGLVLLNVIFMMILAFGKAEYIGRPGKPGDQNAISYDDSSYEDFEASGSEASVADVEEVPGTEAKEPDAKAEETGAEGSEPGTKAAEEAVKPASKEDSSENV